MDENVKDSGQKDKDNLNKLVNAARQKLGQEGNGDADIYKDLREQLSSQEGTQEVEYTVPTFDQQEIPDIAGYNDSHEDYGIDGSDEPVFENGPTEAQLNIWKKQFGYDNVFHVRIIAKDFVFRTLNRLEYKGIVAAPNTDPLLREEIICKTCVLFPSFGYEEMAKQEAGYPSSLSQIIMDASGFTNSYKIEVL